MLSAIMLYLSFKQYSNIAFTSEIYRDFRIVIILYVKRYINLFTNC